MAPIAVMQVIQPAERGAALAARWTNPILLAPVIGAFLQILIFHRAPSIAWPFLVMLAAVITRVLKSRAVVHERPAVLGSDGLALPSRFVGASEIVTVTRDNTVVRVTTKSGEEVELRVQKEDVAQVTATVAALTAAIGAAPHDAIGERLLAEAALPSARGDAYREPAFEVERCLAVAEDAAAAAPVRIAAATFLAKGTDDAARVRISAAAETTASPELREALLAALERSAVR